MTMNKKTGDCITKAKIKRAECGNLESSTTNVIGK